jgi:hypothetical protein
MVSRSEVDMLKIRSEFKKKYGKSLYYYIQVRPVLLGQLYPAIQRAWVPKQVAGQKSGRMVKKTTKCSTSLGNRCWSLHIRDMKHYL